MVRAVVFNRQQVCCPSAATLIGQLLPQQGGPIQFWMLPLPRKIVPEFSTCSALGGWPVAPPQLSAFVHLQPLLGASLPPLGGWFVTPLLLLASVAQLAFPHWEFGTESSVPCSTPILQGRFRVPLPPLLSVSDYNLLLMLFNFVGGGTQSPQRLPWIMFPVCGYGVAHGAWCLPVHSANSHKQP
jgi:hypothetical protein